MFFRRNFNSFPLNVFLCQNAQKWAKWVESFCGTRLNYMKKRHLALVCTSWAGKLELGCRFRGGWAKNIWEKSLWGEAIIWRSRGKPDLKKIPEPLNTLGRINDGRILLSGFSLRRKEKEKEKQHFFDFAPARVWTHDHRKNGSKLPPPSFPRPGLVPVSAA